MYVKVVVLKRLIFFQNSGDDFITCDFSWNIMIVNSTLMLSTTTVGDDNCLLVIQDEHYWNNFIEGFVGRLQ